MKIWVKNELKGAEKEEEKNEMAEKREKRGREEIKEGKQNDKSTIKWSKRKVEENEVIVGENNDEKKRKERRRKFTYHPLVCIYASGNACVRYLSKNVP